jgi:hypothetical protein
MIVVLSTLQRFIRALISILCRSGMASGEESTDNILKLTEEELMDTGEQARVEDIMKNADGLLNSPSSRKENVKKLPVVDKNRAGSVSALVSNLDIGTGSSSQPGAGLGAGTGTESSNISVPLPNINITQQPNGSESLARIQSIQVTNHGSNNTDPDIHRSATIPGADLSKKRAIPEKSDSLRLALVSFPLTEPVVPVMVSVPVPGRVQVGGSRQNI